MVVSTVFVAIEARSCNFDHGYASFLPPQLPPHSVDATIAFIAEVV